jgi:quinol monooxygenase YgiN
MPVVVATLTPRPEAREEVREALVSSLAAVHREPGCQLYALHETDDAFLFVEQWETDEFLERHNSADAVSEVVRRIAGKLKEPVQIVVARPLAGGDVSKGQLVP